ncbi:MAG: glutamate formimidoyltransferase [Euryarchaeota archaeon]|nr:glutamate formimidoyltransferase [Euryarchaeota archaeon]|tara:strand:- start:7956 stop:8984 length:1029 start_codon:yes stop_codon:yes gene_type:complete
MTQPLVECVPNFSEGRDKSVIDSIVQPIVDSSDVTLLDIDMGADFNRTVVTMVGEPEAVLRTVIECTGIALNLIDMSNHSGEHARMGAVDVVPFIPISKVSMAECVELSRRYAIAVSEQYSLPVYLYAKSAVTDQRIHLPDIRKGEYEGLSDKITSIEWTPDYGPAEFIPSMGATATGARNLLIAYNVNLNTSDKSLANSIASKIRSSGSIVKDSDGQIVRDDDGKALRNPGIFSNLQAAGWMYDEDTAQVSMNLLDYSITGLHHVTDSIRTEAAKIGLNVVGSELVGLVPLNAMLDAGRHYSDDGGEERVLVEHAINGLMLDTLEEFDPQVNIIEWAIKER